MRFLAFTILIGFAAFTQAQVQPSPGPVEWGKFSEEELSFTSYSNDPNAHGVILYKEARYTFYAGVDKGIVIDIHRRIKIFDETAYDNLGNFEEYYSNGISSITGIKAQTAYKDNSGTLVVVPVPKESIIEEKLVKGKSGRIKFAFQKLTPGCIVEVKYRINVNIFNLWYLKPWFLQEYSPVLYSCLHGSIPKDLDVRIFPAGLNPNFKVNVNEQMPNGSRRFEFISHHVPAFIEEPFATGYDDYRVRVQFQVLAYLEPPSTWRNLATWPNFAKTVTELLKPKLLPLSSVKQVSEQVTGQLVSDSGRFEAIFKYVQKKILWNGDYDFLMDEDTGLDDVIKSSKGSSADKNLLLISMLGRAGITAKPVLIKRRSQGFLNIAYPVASDFDHLIVQVTIASKSFFVDATHYYNAPYELPYESLNYKGVLLDLKELTFLFVDIPYPKKYSYSVGFDAQLDLEGKKLFGDFDVSLAGIQAQGFRYKLSNDSLASAVLEYIFEGDTTLHSGDLRLENADNPQLPMIIRGTFYKRVEINEVDGELYFSPMLIDRLVVNPHKLESRVLPINLGLPISYTYFFKLNLPKGFELVGQPPNKSITLDRDRSIDFRRTFNTMDNQ